MLKKKAVFAPLDASYLQNYLQLVNSELIWQSTQPTEVFHPYSQEEICTWLKGLSAKDDRRDFALLDADTMDFVGEVVLNYIQGDHCNLRFALLPKYWDQGLGSQGVALAIAYAREQLNLRKIQLSVYSCNPRGIRVYQKSGFAEVSREQIADGLEEILMELAL